MRENKKIKAVFFDLGQTLVEEQLTISTCMHDSLREHLPQLTTDFNELAFTWGHESHKLFMKLREKEFMSAREIHLLCLKNIMNKENVNITDRQARTMVEDVWQDFVINNKIYPDTIPILNQLKQLGYTLGIITDCDEDVANGILQKHNLVNFFDVKVISGVVKAYKPDIRLFNEAIKLAKCTSYEGVYVGDSEIDIKGAKEIGLTTVIVDRRGLKDQTSEIEPDFRIDALSELPKLISRMNNNV